MSAPTRVSDLDDKSLVDSVSTAYSAKAAVFSTQSETSGRSKATLCLGYTDEDLQSVPIGACLSLGCGNPVKAACLKKGENVLDLGSGTGLSVFLTASAVGPDGQVVGIDVSANMIALARAHAMTQGFKPPHVAFVNASLMEPLPIADGTVNCVLSNCVVNLLPKSGKESIFKEVYRVLKPGARVIVDDIVAKQLLPDEIRNDLVSYVNCISGCVELDIYKSLVLDAGLSDVHFLETKHDLQKLEGAGPKPSFDVNPFVASYQITAWKPASDDAITQVSSPNVLLRWWDAYPKAQSSAPLIEPEVVASFIRSNASDFVVIDVRRDDHKGGHVRGSDNCPAQMFYDNLPDFLDKYRNTNKVIFYCGSSVGRGPRCAGWYQDYLDQTGTTTSKAYILKGGLKTWLEKYRDDAEFVDEE